MRLPSGSSRGLMKSVAPNLRAHDSFPGFTSIAITRDAPTRLAALMQLRPTHPQPKTATVEPSESCARAGDNLALIFEAMEESQKRRTDARLFCDGAPARSNATSQEADLVQRGFLIDGDNRDVCHDCILRKR